MSNKKEKILIVDYDLRLQQLLTEYLDDQGYTTFAVGDGEAMQTWLEEYRPDLIILDLMLPGEDGLSLARSIRQQETIPIIILSARGEEMDQIIGLEVGADHYLAKPFNPRELLARIRAVLRRGYQTTTTSENLETNNLPNTKPTSKSKHVFQFGEFNLNIEESRNLETGGSGLGLAIVRQLCEAQGWEITLHSRTGGGNDARLLLSHSEQ